MSLTRLVGVDIGGTGIKLGAVTVGDPPRILAIESLHGHAARSPDQVLPEVAQVISALVSRAGWAAADGVGVGSAGLIGRDTGTIMSSPNLPAWSGTPLRDILSGLLGIPVRVDNDVNAFALAEWRWGAARDTTHAVFLTLGTGIGGAFIADGRLIRGVAGYSGEPGHATLVLRGIDCPCGNQGCAERYVGSEGLVAAARRHPKFGNDPDLGAADPLTPLLLTRAAERGSPVGRDVLAEAGVALGGLLVTLINVLNPEAVVIGGGVAQAGGWLLDPARDHVARHSLVARHHPTRILTAALGESTGVLGAAALVLGDSDPGS